MYSRNNLQTALYYPGMEKKKKDVTSCGCLVYRRNRGGVIEVLLVKPFEKVDAWGAPKGHMDEGETFEECAQREVLEETGLKVVVHDPLPLCHTKNHHENKTVRLYLATTETPFGPLVGDGENAEMKWFHIDELPNLHKYQTDVINGAMAHLAAKFHYDLPRTRGKGDAALAERLEVLAKRFDEDASVLRVAAARLRGVSPDKLDKDFFMDVFKSDGDT